MNPMHSVRRAWTLVEMMVVIVVISVLVALSLSIGSAVLQGSEVQRTENALALLDSAMSARMVDDARSSFSYGFDGDIVPRYMVDPGDAIDGASGACDRCDDLDATVLDYREGGLPSELDLRCLMWSQVSGCSTFETDDDVYRGVSASCFWMLRNHPSSREIITSMDPSLILPVLYQLGSGEEEPGILPVDAWGNPIIVVLPGRDWDDQQDGGSFGNSKRQDDDRTIRTKEEQLLGSALQGRAYFVSAGPDGKFGNIHNDQSLVDGYDPDPSDDGFDDALDNIYSYEVRTW